jgi:hypothetical protein
VFWAAAGISIAIGLVRICFPESKQFIEAKKNGHKNVTVGAFWAETRKMLGLEWKMCIYCIILMTWFNFYRYVLITLLHPPKMPFQG